MTNKEIMKGFKATIDQHFSLPFIPSDEWTLHFIGGVLQSALHILPNDEYFQLKNYCYNKHGYDPGGCQTGQIDMDEWIGGVGNDKL